MGIDDLAGLVSGIRLGPGVSEFDIHYDIAFVLQVARVGYRREAVLGARARIDFLCEGGVGIEVKKGKPNATALMAQAERYCAFESVTALVLVMEGHLVWHPPEIGGKPIRYVALSKGWGLAV